MSDEKQPTTRWVSSDDPAFHDAVRCVMERHAEALRQLAEGPTPNPLQPDAAGEHGDMFVLPDIDCRNKPTLADGIRALLQPECCRRMVDAGWRFEWDSAWCMVSAVRGKERRVLFSGTQPQALHDILSTPEQNEIGTAIARMLNGE